jgi:hypothetical protein
LLCRNGFSPRYLPGEMAEMMVSKFVPISKSIFVSRGLYSCRNHMPALIDGGLSGARGWCDYGVVWSIDDG